MTEAFMRRKREYDYGAGGGNFTGVIVGVDVNSGVGDAGGDSVTVGAVVVSGVGELCVDDVGDDCDAVVRRSLENGISAIRGTSIGTTTAATTAHFIHNKIFDP
jgi:hypothetical protein